MTVDPQQTNGSNVAGGNTTTNTPNVPANQDSMDWKAEAENWKNRYNGQQTAMNKKSTEVQTWQQKYAETLAELEGFKGTTNSEKTEWETKHQTLEKQAKEQATKLEQYERQEKIRSLIHTDFKELANDFEADPIYRAGILSAAATMDEEALKKSLASSRELRKARQTETIESALTGATPSTPAPGATSGATIEQVVEQIRSERNPQKKDALMNKLVQLRKTQA